MLWALHIETLRLALESFGRTRYTHHEKFLPVSQPENLLLSADGRLRIADFGVAQQFAVAGVDAPVRSALARAMSAASASGGSDAGVSSGGESDAEGGDDWDDDSDAVGGGTPVTPTHGGLAGPGAAVPVARSSLTPRLSSRTRPPGWVSDTAGTFAFLAPEACSSGSSGYDAFTADLWAAGVCFYAMLFGRMPFGRGADNPLSLFEAIQSDDLFPLPLHLAADPAALVADTAALDLLTGLLNKDPASRLTLDAAVAHPFVALDLPRQPFRAVDLKSLPAYSNPEIARLEWEAEREARRKQQRASVSAGSGESDAQLSKGLSIATGPSDTSVAPGTSGSVAAEPASAGRKQRRSLLQIMFPSLVSQRASTSSEVSSTAAAPGSTALAPIHGAITQSSSDRELQSSGAVGSPARPSTSLASCTDGEPVTLEGWLYKRGRAMKTWQRRFFRLCGRVLLYYDHDPRASPPISAARAVATLRSSSDAVTEPASFQPRSRSFSDRLSGSFFFRFASLSFSRSRSRSSMAGSAAADVDAALASTSGEGPSPAAAAPSQMVTQRLAVAKGRMELQGPMRVTRAAGSLRPNHFCVETASRTLHLQADNSVDEQAWLSALESLASEAGHR